MSDTTDEARRLNNQPIRYQPPREVINAMLDVIDAAKGVDADGFYYRGGKMSEALARYREVASGSKPFSSDTEADR